MFEFFKDHIIEIIASFGGISGLLGWKYERNKRKQEQLSAETKNQKSVIDLYQEALDDLKIRYDKKFEELEADLQSVRTNLELWKTKHRKLKEEYEKYKLGHESE